MMAISLMTDFIEDIMEVFMDDFSVYGITFDHCLKNLSKVLQRCEDMNLVLNWEKCISWCKRGLSLVILSLIRALKLTKQRWK